MFLSWLKTTYWVTHLHKQTDFSLMLSLKIMKRTSAEHRKCNEMMHSYHWMESYIICIHVLKNARTESSSNIALRLRCRGPSNTSRLSSTWGTWKSEREIGRSRLGQSNRTELWGSILNLASIYIILYDRNWQGPSKSMDSDHLWWKSLNFQLLD